MSLTVFGWPRTGTHYLKAILEGVLDIPVTQSHEIPDEDGQYVYTIRDPRDAFLSHYNLVPRDRTQMEHFVHFFQGKGMTIPFLNLGWKEYQSRATNTLMKYLIPVVSFERLRADPVESIDRVLRHFQLSSVRSIQGVVNGLIHTRCDPSGLPSENMGRVGYWKTELGVDVVSAMNVYLGRGYHE